MIEIYVKICRSRFKIMLHEGCIMLSMSMSERELFHIFVLFLK